MLTSFHIPTVNNPVMPTKTSASNEESKLSAPPTRLSA
jgi:hypothetical protein